MPIGEQQDDVTAQSQRRIVKGTAIIIQKRIALLVCQGDNSIHGPVSLVLQLLVTTDHLKAGPACCSNAKSALEQKTSSLSLMRGPI